VTQPCAMADGRSKVDVGERIADRVTTFDKRESPQGVRDRRSPLLYEFSPSRKKVESLGVKKNAGRRVPVERAEEGKKIGQKGVCDQDIANLYMRRSKVT